MDAFELLLRATDRELNPEIEVNDSMTLGKSKLTFDYRDHMTSTMLDPIDSIMLLADQACQKSPMKKGREGALTPPTVQLADMPPVSNFGDDTKGLGTLLQYGTYFSTGSPFAGPGARRSRAMSEPWVRQDNWAEELHFNSTMGTSIAGNSGGTSALLHSALSSALASEHGSNGGHSPGAAGGLLNGTSSGMFPSFSFNGVGAFSRGAAGLYNAEHRLGYSALDSSLPHMLDQYAAIYNKNGRIGIYTREERVAIIHRFREKRKRRVWKKKIRYFCRKNLADRRVRVKGRFVKSSAKPGVGSSSSSTSGGSDNNSPTTTSTTAPRVASSTVSAPAGLGTAGASYGNGHGLPPRAGLRNSAQRAHSNSGDFEGTDVSDLTSVASHRPSRAGSAAPSVRGGGSGVGARAAASATARQALTSPGSDDEEEEEDMEEDEGNNMEEAEDDQVQAGEAQDAGSMEVVIGGESARSSAAPTAVPSNGQQKPARRLKLVLTASSSSTQQPATGAGTGAGTMDLVSPTKLVFRNIKAESAPSIGASQSPATATATAEQELSGVDLLASIAAKTASDSDADEGTEDGDVFTADMDVLRLPTGKRVRRHSIAY